MIGLADHPWLGGLLGDDAIAAVFSAKAELRRFLQVEAAWTRALGSVEGIAEAETVAARIEAAEIDIDALAKGTAQDGVPIPALVRDLKGQLGRDAPIHRGMTSQDVMDTAQVLALQQVMDILTKRLRTLAMTLDQSLARFGTAPVMAFTRMQPALGTNGAELIGRWARPVNRLLADIARDKAAIGDVQWGGPIGIRDHPKADALGACFAQKLGLRDPGYAWHTDRAVILSVGHILSQVAIATGKIGEDLALMAALGKDYVTLAGGGSSAMPHKNNPIKAEVLVTLADFAATQHAGLLRAVRHEGFRSGRAWTLEWMVLPQLCIAAGASARLAAQAVSDITSLGGQS